MKNIAYILCFFSFLLGTVGFAAEAKIKLSGRKDAVLSSSERATVLEVADRHLGEKDTAFLAKLSQFVNPYAFKTDPVEKPQAAANDMTVESADVVYDDASVLKVIASNFSKQVRGTLARGTTSYLQLQGGNLLKAGTEFPVRLPGVQNVTYSVTLIEVTPEGYTLQLGESTLTLSYDSGSGAVKYSP